MRLARFITLASALAVVPPLAAQTPTDRTRQPGSPAQAAVPAAVLVDGEVRRVDKEAKKLTIRHGPIPNLEMPAMTMVFQVGDPAMLDAVKAGDKIKFSAQRHGGAFVVTKIEPAN